LDFQTGNVGISLINDVQDADLLTFKSYPGRLESLLSVRPSTL